MPVFNKPLEIYVFIRQNGTITGVEILDGIVSIDTEIEIAPSDDVFVHREPTGRRFIKVKGKMGATESRDGMPNYQRSEQGLIEEEEK